MTIKGNKKDALLNLLANAFKAGYDSCLLDQDLYFDADDGSRDSALEKCLGAVTETMSTDFEKWEQCDPNHYVDAIVTYMVDEID